MNKSDFIKKNTGKDKLRGRPIRLNKFELPVKEGKDYAELVAFGDLHLGHPQCNVKKATEMLDYCEKHNIAVLLMGDSIEAGIAGSVGDSVYKQKLNPQEQMETMVELLTPLAKKGLIKGLHSGNHEVRITNATGIDIAKVMARLLNVSYLGYACWNMIKVGKQKYSCYSQHGKGSPKFKHSKLKKILDQMAWQRADLLLIGHFHSLDSNRTTVQEVDFRNRVVREKKVYACITGSYIGYDDSYAQVASMPPCEIGSPKIKLMANERDVFISY